MNRRSGLSPMRVERRLARAADAIEAGCGERPEVPGRDPEVEGRPFWEVHGETMVYTLVEDGAPVWRWETTEVDTLAFWAIRDATFRLAVEAEERTRPPGDPVRETELLQGWAHLMGLGDPAWRTRHEAWLAATEGSGEVAWPNPPAVVALIERVAASLAARAGQPHGPLPGWTPRDDARPWIETHGDELVYRVRAAGRDLRRDRSTDVGDLLFWVFEPVTREMARSASSGGDWRGRWAELMETVNPEWRARLEAAGAV